MNSLTVGLLAAGGIFGGALLGLIISALSVSGAIFIILEMNHPLQGMIKVSSGPMREALEHLGH